MAFLPVDQQLEILTRGVEKIVPEAELRQKLEQSYKTGKPLRIKYGIDPTGIDLHLGHTVPMRKMRQFQQLGHKAVIIIGNYTALVGDPSGRDETRARLTAEQVEANARDYLKQVGRVINLNEAEVHRNGDWFSQMDFARILELCSKVTIAQLLVRDDFSKRFKAEKPIYLHECLYPLMQGWDSVEIEADVELGGTEQLYTFMLARDLQRERGLPLQVGVMSPILVGTDGTKRMGKSLGNYIGIAESPFEMTKKFMQLPDDVMRSYFELLTDLPLDQVDQILAGHPKAAKQELARQIMRQYSSEAEANEAIERWEKEIGSGGGLPAEIPVVHLASALIENGTVNAVDLLCHLNLVNTKSEARRLIQQGGAKLGPEKQPIGDIADAIQVASGLIVWAGKKKFCQIEIA